jgi:hypothetical protein
LIRKANSWKKVRFKLPIKHMDLDVGDCITLDVGQFSPDQIKVVIEQMTLNTEENTLDVICWTPIRSGETAPYYWAWPAAQAEVAIWPLDGDPNGGAGYNFEVTPPVGHLLLGGSHRDDQLVITTGDRNPSDIGDVVPSLTCELSDYLNFDEEDPSILAKHIAESAARQAMELNIGGGGNSGGASENKDDGGGTCGSGSGCNYKVDVQWHTSEAQGSARGAGLESAPGGPCGGPCGCLDKGGCPSCYGPIWTVCHSFGTLWAARSFADYMEATYGYPEDHYWFCNQTAVLNTFVSDGSHSGPGAEDCESAGTESETGNPNDGTVGGETQDPVGSTGREPG